MVAMTTEEERLAAGWCCDGCGSMQTIKEIRKEHPRAISCCPERKLVPPGRREMTIIMDEAADISPVEWEKMIRQIGSS